LALGDGLLYGTIREGGNNNLGSVFRIATNGTGFLEILHFNGVNGSYPNGGLVLSGDILYGTTRGGGSWNNGVVFKLWDFGTAFSSQVIKNLSTNEGTFLNGGLAMNGATLYGTTRGYLPPIAPPGGDMLFKLQTDGSGFLVLSNLTGRNPAGGLLSLGNMLCGSAQAGLTAGSVYRISNTGANLTTLRNFSGTDGSGPSWKLVLSGDSLYGMTLSGGDFDRGTVFKINTNGSDFVTLKSFPALTSNTNSDGAAPVGGLLLSGNTLYGATSAGGSGGRGVVFKINTDGSGFAVLKHFPPATLWGGGYTNSEGASPIGDLVISAGTLYGTTSSGGRSGKGVIFSLVAPPTIEMPGVRSNRFGFYVTGDSGQPVVVESCTNLVVGNWTALLNLNLGSTPFYFSHLQWTNSLQRFYRVRVR